MLKKLLALSLIALAGGCGAETRRYDVRVRNRTSETITIGLAKDSGPYEEAWAPPEQLRGQKEKLGDTWGLAAVPPGNVANAQNITGQFARRSQAWLRVYAGELTLGEMLKIQPGSLKRVDVPLKPGANVISITTREGRLVSAPDAKP